MSEIFGILDILESTIIDGRKIPMTEKVVLDERQLLTLIEKARVVLKSKGEAAWQAIDHGSAGESEKSIPVDVAVSEREYDERKVELIRIRDETRQYADNVMAQLQLIVTKMQTQLIKMESTLRNGREIIETSDYGSEEGAS